MNISYIWYNLLYGSPYHLSCRLELDVQAIYRHPILVIKYVISSRAYVLYVVVPKSFGILLSGPLYKTDNFKDIRSVLCMTLRRLGLVMAMCCQGTGIVGTNLLCIGF